LSGVGRGGIVDAMTTTPDRSHWSALPVLLAGAFMVVLDFFIVNVALPSMAADLHAADTSLEWVVAGYGLSFAAFLVLAGRLGDELGRRRVYAVGLALFVLTSAACGIAPDAATLVAARVAQGIAGAIVMPQVLSIVGVTYRGEDYAKALSAYGVALGIAATGGQIVGGALVQLDVLGIGWRGCFLINVPIGLLALALTPRLVPESRAPRRGRVDVAGAVVLALGLGAVLLPLIEGRRYGWPEWTWLSLAAAPVILGGFLGHQSRIARRGGAPLLDLRLFRRRAFSSGLATQLCLASAQASFFVYLALYLQQGRGLGALGAGLVFSILAVAYVAVSGPAPRLTERFGRSLVAVGGATLAAGLCALAVAVSEVGVGGSLLALVPGLLLAGAGIGLCYTPLTATVLAAIEPDAAGAASGAMSTAQQVGYALGVAITGLVFFGERASGVGHAFELSLLQLAALGLAIVAFARLLPVSGRAASPAAGPLPSPTAS
jgi:EmrB/QacA subfamily drug resistance transporter